MKDLITIGVITFNSELTVLDTLDSIKQLNYRPIQLIISDDFSSDNTINVCKKWLDANSEYFQDTLLITAPENKGTAANCNKVLAKTKGVWLKIIAGDDILLPESINLLHEFAEQHSDASWIVSKHHTYNGTFAEGNYLQQEDKQFSDEWKKIFLMDVKDQYYVILRRNFMITPSSIINTQILRDLGGYEEKYGLLEDYPLYIKFLKKGIKAYLCDEFTMGYRRGDNNVCASNVKLFNIRYVKAKFQVQKDMCFTEYSFNRRMFERLFYYECVLLDCLHMNNARSATCRFVYNGVRKVLRTFFWSKLYEF